MKLQVSDLSLLAQRLAAERKRQGLSRTQAAAVCNVSTSFIRDAENAPDRCSLGKLLLLVQGLGLSVQVLGWGDESANMPPPLDDTPHHPGGPVA
jgi:HTH-type transcriptional regulator/antitoxin HipB